MFNSPSGDKFNSFWRGRERKFLHMSQNVFMLHHCTHCLLCLVNNLHTLLLEKRIIKIHDLFFLLIFSFIKNLIHIFLGVGFVGFVKNHIFQTFLDSFFCLLLQTCTYDGLSLKITACFNIVGKFCDKNLYCRIA